MMPQLPLLPAVLSASWLTVSFPALGLMRVGGVQGRRSFSLPPFNLCNLLWWLYELLCRRGHALHLIESAKQDSCIVSYLPKARAEEHSR